MKSVNDGEGFDEEPLFEEKDDRLAQDRTNVRVIVAVVVIFLVFVVVLFGSVALGVALNKGCGSAIECLASEVRSNMDTSIDPCKDFYKYSCGGWERKYTISPSVTSVTRFAILNQKNVNSLSSAIESGKDGNVPAVKLARKFYDSCMDTGQLDEMGSQPLLELVRNTGGWKLINAQNLSVPAWSLNSADFVDSHALGNPAFFTFSVTINATDTSRHMAQITQSGLTLGSADLYEIPQQVTNLQNFIAKVLGLLGSSSSSSQAASIVTMEKELAKIFVSSDVRDPYAKYNPTTLEALNTTWSDFNWDNYVKARFARVGITVSNGLIVNNANPSYFSNLTTVYKMHSQGEWENYFKWQLVRKYVPYLGTNHLRAVHSFRQSVVPYTLARLYTKYILPNGTREEMSDIVTSIKMAFIEQLKNNTWLDQQTIDASIEKVNAIIENVAYPQFVFNDSAIYDRSKPIISSGGAFFDTFREDLIYSIQTQLALLNKPVDRYQWLGAPTQVNAFYSPTFNKFEFEEGILNSPFFVAGWPNYFKFGAIGMVAGHELTHGFDDQGHQYNKQGDLTRWWTNASLEAFNKRAKCFVSQYSSYSLQGHQINGQRTLGENIADNGGLKTAYRAYRDNINSSMSQVTLPSINLTPDQLFFVAFSQLWCGLFSDNGLTRLVNVDPHSPTPIRVLGTLSNSVEFATAFNCPVNSPMNPSSKCILW